MADSVAVIVRIQMRPSQQLTRVFMQQTHEQHFRRGAALIATAYSPKSSRFAYWHPIRSPVAGAFEARRIDKCFHQQHRMTESKRPVSHHLPRQQRERPRGQIRNRLENQKPRLIRDQMQPADASSDQSVSHRFNPSLTDSVQLLMVEIYTSQ